MFWKKAFRNLETEVWERCKRDSNSVKEVCDRKKKKKENSNEDTCNRKEERRGKFKLK